MNPFALRDLKTLCVSKVEPSFRRWFDVRFKNEPSTPDSGRHRMATWLSHASTYKVTCVAMYCQKCQEFAAIDVGLASEGSSMFSGLGVRALEYAYWSRVAKLRLISLIAARLA